MEGRVSIRVLVLVVLAGLALVTQLPALWGGGSIGDASRKVAAPAVAHFTGPLPSAFSLTGVLSGPDEEPGLDLPDGTSVVVRGTKAEWKAGGDVAKLVGVSRLTGRERFAFTGRLDRKTDTISGPAHWTLKGRVGDRLIDWRFDGTFSASFKDGAAVTGRLSGVRVVTERGSSGGAPQVQRGTLAWSYEGLRSR